MDDRNPARLLPLPDPGAVESAGAAIAVLSGEAICCSSEPFRQCTGLTAQESCLADLLGWIVPEDRPEFLQHLEAPLETKGLSTSFDLRGASGGRRRCFHAQVQCLDGLLGSVILLSLNEVVPLPRADRDALIDEAKFHHDARLAALGTMAAGIAHELNQPLNTIRVITEGLLFGREKGWPLEVEEFFENVEMISRQVVRMDKVIQNIRNFARENRDQEIASVSVNEAIENVFSMIGRQIEDHGIRVEKDLEPELPPLRTTLNELEQVVMNLLLNARQSLDECDEPLKVIRVKTECRDSKILLEVSDNGPGIPAPLHGRIFDPFFTTKGPGKGTGLGLSISQSIVSKFGGRIEVRNNDDGGATFVLTAEAYGGSR